MKCAAALVVIFIFYHGAQSEQTAEDREWRHKIAITCITRVGIDRKIIEKAMQTTILPKDDVKYKQFLACSYKKQGYQSEEGKILLDNIKAFLKDYYEYSRLSILDNCDNNPGENSAEAAFNALDCILPKLKSLD